MKNHHKTHSKKNIIKKIMVITSALVLVVILVEGLLLWRLERQRLSYKNYWKMRAAESVSPNALWYVALGDSAAVGIGASRPENSYVGILERRLKEKTKQPVHVVNLGVTGARVADVINDQLPQLTLLNLPTNSLITLEIGSNNIKTFDKDSFSKEFENLIKQLPRQSIVADIPFFGGGRANAKEDSAKRASQIIEKLAFKYNMRLVRLHDATKEHDSWRNYAADYFHPNNRSYRIWADAFWKQTGYY